MLYNTNSVVPSDQLLAAKLKKLAHSPLTASDICQDWPTLRKMSLIGEALKDRILVICTDDSKSDSPPPLLLHQTAVDEDTNEQLNGININNGSAKNIFDLMDSLGALEETWEGGRAKSCLRYARTSQPFTSLTSRKRSSKMKYGYYLVEKC